MQTLYNLAIGPLAWAAWAIFIAGSIWRLTSMASLARRKEMGSVAYLNFGFSMRSIFHWLIPFGTMGWKSNPLLTVATFAFHICLLLLVLFAEGHAVLWEYAFGIGLWALSPQVATAMTMIVIACCVVFAARRVFVPSVRYVTTAHDWAVLALVAIPFITGLLAKQQLGDPLLMTLLHVLSGEGVLIAIPFTRLSHALFIPFTRAYMGSEFGGVRHCPDW